MLKDKNSVLKSLRKKLIVITVISLTFIGIGILDMCPSASKELLESGFIAFILGSFFAVNFEFYNRLVKIRKVNGFSWLFVEFFTWGLSLTFSGLTATSLAMVVNLLDVANKFSEVVNFYVQISLNFILGGVTLIGASLPVVHSLFGQSKGETASTPQSSGESGDCQQSK